MDTRYSITTGTILADQRDSSLPLMAGLVVAVLVHLVLIAGVETVQREKLFSFMRSPSPDAKNDTPSSARRHPAALKHQAANAPEAVRQLAAALAEPVKLPARQPAAREEPEQDPIRFGKDNGDPLSLAWIGYDDFQDMVALRGNTEQPALQKDVAPTPGAPLRPDPTSARPAQAATPAVPGSPGSPDAAPLAAVPARVTSAANPQPSPTAQPKPRALPAPTPTPLPAPTAAASKPPAVAPAPVQIAKPPVDPAPLALDDPQKYVKLPTSPGAGDAPRIEKPVETPAPKPPGEEATKKTSGAELSEPKDAARVTPAAKLDKGEASILESERLAMVLPRIPEPIVPPTVTTRPAPPAEKPGESDDPDTKAAIPAPPATQPTGNSSAAPAAPGVVGSPGSPGAPGTLGVATGAPRADSESAPVSLNGGQAIDVRPGRVVAGEGIEISTAHPRFSAVALSSSIPKNPLVRIVFDKYGTVIEAEVLRSSGYPNIDGPILASLYKWKASGKKLEQLNRSFEVKINIILLREEIE